MAAQPGRRQRSRPSDRAAERGSDAERGLRGLVGAGPSQVGVSGAMRARDAARPTAADEAAAEEQVRLVRRNYKPPPPVKPPGAASPGPPGNPGNVPERS